MATGQKRKPSSDQDEARKQPKKQDGATEREDKLLAFMMSNFTRGDKRASFRRCAKALDFMERTKTQRQAWQALLDKGFIEPCDVGGPVFTSDHSLTEKGKTHASTPEYIEYLKDLNFVAETNEEHQARLKKKFINDHGRRIFDLLLEHGSLTRKEMAAIIGVNDRSHAFSYALQQLKDSKNNKATYVENDTSAGKNKLRLADSAFLEGQRPAVKPSDPEKIAALIREKEASKAASRATKPKKVKNVAKNPSEKATKSPSDEDASISNDDPETIAEEEPVAEG